MTQLSTTRPDIDIEGDVIEVIVRYPPLAADRHYIRTRVENGVVYLSGNTTTSINQRYLTDRARAIPGVVDVDDSALFDDPRLVLEIGSLIPEGVIANAYYGSIVLSGREPEDVDAVALSIAQVPGVVRVVTMFTEDTL